ncbi:MAG: hypothetical protein ACREDC_15310 [Bradyrhizobium sp.]
MAQHPKDGAINDWIEAAYDWDDWIEVAPAHLALADQIDHHRARQSEPETGGGDA